MTPSASFCAVHTDRAASGVCERCGAFGCADCLGLVGVVRLCAACRARENAGLPDLLGRARWATPFLWITAGLGVVVSLGSFLIDPQSLESEGEPNLANAFVALGVGCAGILYLVTFIVGIVLFCRWFHLLVRHAKARGAPLEDTPAFAVGSFFIPFVNLVRPFAIARQTARSEGVTQRIGAWQALWLGANIVANVGSRLEGKAQLAGNAVGLFGAVLLVAAAWACADVVKQLTAQNAPGATLEPG